MIELSRQKGMLQKFKWRKELEKKARKGKDLPHFPRLMSPDERKGSLGRMKTAPNETVKCECIYTLNGTKKGLTKKALVHKEAEPFKKF